MHAVTSRWPGRFFRGPRDDESVRRAQVAMTAAFLDMDNRQSIAQAAVHASDQLFPDRRLRQLWTAVEERCFQAASAYVTVRETFDAVVSEAARVSFERSTQQMISATQGIDEFYDTHRAHLDQATATLATIPRLAQQALAAAETVRHSLHGPNANYADYPSVRAAAIAVDQAVNTLEAARPAAPAGAVREAANRVLAAVTALEQSLAGAPGRDHQARLAVSSVTTRLAAVRTRAERLAPAYSALLREFNAASSADLLNNERESRRHVDEAAADLTDAATALAGGNPERALESANAARTHLADAEACVDAVTDRLSALRAVREDPRTKERDVRFRLRDAQMLAVNQGLVPEWGSVLDAQLERIDRIAGTLTGRHPDYWAYLTQLDAVSTFIADVVHKMKGQARSQ